MRDTVQFLCEARSARRALVNALRAVRFAPALCLALVGAAAVAGGPVLGSALAAEAGIDNAQAPSVTGSARIGGLLTCSPGSWTGSPTGYVYSWLRDGVPIAGQSADTFTVAGEDAGVSISCDVTASRGGEYEVTGLPSGVYTVDFNPLGSDYLPQFFSGKPEAAQATPVDVKQGASTGGVDATLATAGSIAGRVTSTSGASLAGLRVCAEASYEACARTNANGEYTIGGLAMGAYAVHFEGERCEAESCIEAYESQYYDGTTKGKATEVAVAPPNTTGGIDASLVSTGPTGSISGEVRGEGAGPLAEVEVCAAGQTSNSRGCERTDADGEYVIAGLPVGEYTLSFAVVRESKALAYISQWYEGEPSEAEAEVVHLTPAGLTGIDATLEDGATIAGKLTSASSGQPVPGAEVCASNDAAIELIGDGRCTMSEADGEYEIVGLPSGEYEVSTTRDPSSDLLASSTTDVMLAAKEAKKGVGFSLEAGGSIAGHVTAATNGAPITGMQVCAYGGPEHEQQAGCASTDGNGEYDIAALSADGYAVKAGCVDRTRECSEAYLSAQYPIEVTVAPPGTKPNVDFSLAEGGRIVGVVTGATSGDGIGGVGVSASEVEGSPDVGSAVTHASESASATSNAVAIPALVFEGGPELIHAPSFRLVKKSYDAKKGRLDLWFEFSAAGKVRWKLTFPSSETTLKHSVELAPSESAKRMSNGGKSRKCKHGKIRRADKCVAKTVSFATGSRSVGAGEVEVKIDASAAARKLIDKGKKLHVSGRFGFTADGSSASLQFKYIVKAPKKTPGGGKHHIGKRA